MPELTALHAADAPIAADAPTGCDIGSAQRACGGSPQLVDKWNVLVLSMFNFLMELNLASVIGALDRLPAAIGRSVCAGDPGHSLWGGSPQLSLCARCIAMHLALAACLLALRALRSRAGSGRGGWSPSLFVGGLLLVPISLDVALIHFGWWRGDNTLRLATGALAGPGLALVLAGAVQLSLGSGAQGSALGWRHAAGCAPLLAVLVVGLAFAPPIAAPALSALGACAVVLNLAAFATTLVRGLTGRVFLGDRAAGAVVALAVLVASSLMQS